MADHPHDLGQRTLRTCVVGAGAVGGWVAARLALAGNDVAVLARGETLRAIESAGLRISEGGETEDVAVAAAADAAQLGAHDLVVIALKAQALPQIASDLSPLVGPASVVVPMMNGVPWWFTHEPLRSVDPDGSTAAALPIEQVVGCVVHAACRRAAPNHVEVGRAEKLILGEPAGGGSSARVARLCALFEEAGIHCEQSDNIRRAIWYKLWGNATFNPLSALTRSTAEKLLNDGEVRAMMAEAMDELAAVGAAIDCPIAETAEDRMAVAERLGPFKTSMLQDVEAGRPIELDALLAAPREIAQRVGVPTPKLDRIYAMTRLMAANLGLL